MSTCNQRSRGPTIPGFSPDLDVVRPIYFVRNVKNHSKNTFFGEVPESKYFQVIKNGDKFA